MEIKDVVKEEGGNGGIDEYVKELKEYAKEVNECMKSQWVPYKLEFKYLLSEGLYGLYGHSDNFDADFICEILNRRGIAYHIGRKIELPSVYNFLTEKSHLDIPIYEYGFKWKVYQHIYFRDLILHWHDEELRRLIVDGYHLYKKQEAIKATLYVYALDEEYTAEERQFYEDLFLLEDDVQAGVFALKTLARLKRKKQREENHKKLIERYTNGLETRKH